MCSSDLCTPTRKVALAVDHLQAFWSAPRRHFLLKCLQLGCSAEWTGCSPKHTSVPTALSVPQSCAVFRTQREHGVRSGLYRLSFEKVLCRMRRMTSQTFCISTSSLITHQAEQAVHANGGSRLSYSSSHLVFVVARKIPHSKLTLLARKLPVISGHVQSNGTCV